MTHPRRADNLGQTQRQRPSPCTDVEEVVASTVAMAKATTAHNTMQKCAIFWYSIVKL